MKRIGLITCFIMLYTIFFSSMLFAQVGFDEIFGSALEENEPVSNPVTVSGHAGIDVSSFIDCNSEISVVPDLAFEFGWSNANSDASVRLRLHPYNISDPFEWERIIDTVSIRRFFPWGHMELGFLKKEWGKGDGIHALDPLNTLDQRHGIKADLQVMKIAEPMISIAIGTADIRGQLVYKPISLSVLPAITGPWSVIDPAYAALIDPAAIPKTNTLEFGQFAGRIDVHHANIDVGIMAFMGHMSQPSFAIRLDPSTYQPVSIQIGYTRAFLTGIDVGFAAGPFTFMSEAGIWISEDFNASDSDKYNNACVYQAGFDVTIPSSTIIISAQLNGRYILDLDTANPLDVDMAQAYGGKPYANTMITAINSTWFKDRIETRLAFLWQIESNGYVFMPMFTWKLDDAVSVQIEATVYGSFDSSDGIESIYERWDGNDTITICTLYTF